MPTFLRILASTLSGVIWTFTLALIPIIEDIICPVNDTSDSWQRGYIIFPFVLFLSIPLIYFVTYKILQKGPMPARRFVHQCGLISIIAGLTFFIPMAITWAIVEGQIGLTGLYGMIYLLAILYFAALPAAGIWWLVGAQPNNKYCA